MSRDKDHRRAHSAATAATLSAWAHDSSSSTRWWPARDERTPPEALEHLVEEGGENIRWEVADNPAAPLTLLRRLAQDASWRVRLAVVYNPSVPPEALVQLLADPHDLVRGAALWRCQHDDRLPAEVRMMATIAGLGGTMTGQAKEVQ